MSNRTREINKITTAIITISVKLMLVALLVLLLYEAVVRGYSFGHEIFYAEAVEEAPGRDITIDMGDDESVSAAADALEKKGLLKSKTAFLFQSRFYDYDTIYPGTYTLNTSMTSKEILQKLNEKPKDEKTEMKSGSSRAAAATESTRSRMEETGQAAKAASETGASPQTKAGAVSGESQEQADAERVQDEQANERTYAGEDQDAEGGWIEDVTEE